MNHVEQPNRAVCNAISLAAPFVGFVCGVVAGVCGPHMQWFEWGFRTWLAFGFAGLLAGVIALVRSERLWGLTLTGLILNAGLVFFLVAWFDFDPRFILNIPEHVAPTKTVPQPDPN